MLDPAGLAPAFRDEWPRLVATLVRDLGDLDIAEDAVQEAFVEAARRWPAAGRPNQPGAWLLTVARRKAIDRARRAGVLAQRLAELETALAAEPDPPRLSSLLDDQLALLLGCCHPALNRQAQIALTLRVVAGLSTKQISNAFLVSDQTMVRRITRAKTKIREASIPFVVPDPGLLADRVEAVTQVIYLIFTEGHTSSTDASLVRGDLCDEAMWLAKLLRQLVPNNAEVLGLAALINLTDSRRDTRTNASRLPILLEDQDRSLWDREKIELGLALLRDAHNLGYLGPFQIQAAIQALHTSAPTFKETSWAKIVSLYDLLLVELPTAVVALNRAVAYSYVAGPDVALPQVAALEEALNTYVYFHVAKAELLLRARSHDDAAVAFTEALVLSENETERLHISRRIEQCRDLAS